MANAREMRLRIRRVKNIAQVTRALEAVSASRVRRAQEAVNASRAYAGKAFEVLQHLALQGGSMQNLHPLLEERSEIKAIDLLMISSDRGLAGAYNINVTRKALDFMTSKTVPIRWLTVGRKGRDLVYRRGANIAADFENFRDLPSYLDTNPIGQVLLEDYLNGTVDEVYLAYTDYISTVRQVPRVRRLLPLSAIDAEEQVMAEHLGGAESTVEVPYIYEPAPEELLDVILPRFTQVQIYQAVLESLASEHSARMVAMRNATDNANELVGSLQLAYNKARQLSVTSELLDIVGGVEAQSKAFADT